MILLIGLVTKNSILLVEYTNQLKERGHDDDRCRARGGADPAPADSHDLGRHGHGRACRSRSVSAPARSAGGRSATRSWAACSSPRCSRSSWSRRCTCSSTGLLARTARTRAGRARQTLAAGGGRVMLALLLALQVAAGTGTVPAADTVPRITLAEAIRALGPARPGLRPRARPDRQRRVGAAGRGRRVLRARDLRSAWTRPSTPPSFFNPADPANPTSTLVVGSRARRLRALQPPQVRRARPDQGGARERGGRRAGAAVPRRAGNRVRATTTCWSTRSSLESPRSGSSRAEEGLERRAGPGGLGRGGADRLAAAGAGADPRPGRRAAPAERAPHRALELGRRVGEPRAGRCRAARHTPRRRISRSRCPRRCACGARARGRSIRSAPGQRARRRVPALKGAEERLPSDPQHRRAAPALRHRALPQRAPTSARSPSVCRSRSGTTGSARSR